MENVIPLRPKGRHLCVRQQSRISGVENWEARLRGGFDGFIDDRGGTFLGVRLQTCFVPLEHTLMTYDTPPACFAKLELGLVGHHYIYKLLTAPIAMKSEDGSSWIFVI
jgi:hypothetical protein